MTDIHQIPGLAGNTKYAARMAEVDVFGNMSDWSDPQVFTTGADTTAPAVPTSLSATAGILMNVVAWVGVSDSDLDHYELAVSTDGGSTFPTVHKLYTTISAISGLTAGTAYTYKVRAVDSSGNASAYTSTVAATPRKVTGSGTGGTDIAAASITAADITADSITANEIAANAITASELAANAVTAAKILAGEIGTTHFSASATISLVSNVGATVVIDSTGITITNGKLTLQDEFGKSVIGASGFDTTWLDFLRTGLYNGMFVSGSATGSTIADGRTPALPYWTVSRTGSTPTLTRTADASYPGGFRMRVTTSAGNQNIHLLSDKVAVVPGEYYSVDVVWGYNVASAGAVVRLMRTVNWYKADGTTLIHSDTISNVDKAATTSAANERQHSFPTQAPLGARWATVDVGTGEVTGTHNAANYGEFGSVSLVHNVNLDDILETGVIAATGDITTETSVIAPDGQFGTTLSAGALDVAGALTAHTMPFMVMLPFTFVGTLSGSAVNIMNPADAAFAAASQARASYYMPFAGSIVAVNVTDNSSRTGGSALAKAMLNDAAVGASIQPQLNSSSAVNSSLSQARGVTTFNAGDRIGATLVTSSWTPVANNIQIQIYVVFDAVT